MSWIAVAVAGGTLVGGIYAANKQASATQDASNAQVAAAQAGTSQQLESSKLAIDEQRRQFDAIQKILAPYNQAGVGALGGQQDLLGLNGAGPQGAAIAGIQGSPMFGALAQQGEDAILANASATGGLRGGNTQGALAQFRPALLNGLIDQQYQRLGGLTSLGQNSAALTGNAGLATGQGISGNLLGTGSNIAQLLQQQGAAQAGGALGQGRAAAGLGSAFTSSLGTFAGLGGFGGGGGYGGLGGQTAVQNQLF